MRRLRRSRRFRRRYRSRQFLSPTQDASAPAWCCCSDAGWRRLLRTAFSHGLTDGKVCQILSQKILFTAAKHSRTKNDRFGPFLLPRPMKNQGAEDQNLHKHPTFVHVFRSNFATFCVSVSTPNFQKSTPNFQKSLTFFSQRTPVFVKINSSR